MIAKKNIHVFNAYTKAYNKKYQRLGSLFCKTFRRISINNDIYFKVLVVYIHKNPVHYGFVDDFKDYPWSSYGTILSNKPTKLQRENELGWFDSQGNFIILDQTNNYMDEIHDLIIE